MGIFHTHIMSFNMFFISFFIFKKYVTVLLLVIFYPMFFSLFPRCMHAIMPSTTMDTSQLISFVCVFMHLPDSRNFWSFWVLPRVRLHLGWRGNHRWGAGCLPWEDARRTCHWTAGDPPEGGTKSSRSKSDLEKEKSVLPTYIRM